MCALAERGCNNWLNACSHMLYTAWLDILSLQNQSKVDMSAHTQFDAQLLADLAWHVEVHFADWQIEITAGNVIPLNKDKRAGPPFMGLCARLLQELLQILFFFVLLITCMPCTL